MGSSSSTIETPQQSAKRKLGCLWWKDLQRYDEIKKGYMDLILESKKFPKFARSYITNKLETLIVTEIEGDIENVDVTNTLTNINQILDFMKRRVSNENFTLGYNNDIIDSEGKTYNNDKNELYLKLDTHKNAFQNILQIVCKKKEDNIRNPSGNTIIMEIARALILHHIISN